MAPDRRTDISSCGLRALIAGSVSCFMTACIAGDCLLFFASVCYLSTEYMYNVTPPINRGFLLHIALCKNIKLNKDCRQFTCFVIFSVTHNLSSEHASDVIRVFNI